MRKKSNSEISKLQNKLRELCKKINRAKYPHFCYTCGRAIDGIGMHTGHFIPKASCPAELKYALENLRLQCYHCNINLGGNGGEFYRRLEQEIGKDAVEDLFRRKQITGKADKFWYEEKIKEYEEILETVDNSHTN